MTRTNNRLGRSRRSCLKKFKTRKSTMAKSILQKLHSCLDFLSSKELLVIIFAPFLVTAIVLYHVFRIFPVPTYVSTMAYLTSYLLLFSSANSYKYFRGYIMIVLNALLVREIRYWMIHLVIYLSPWDISKNNYYEILRFLRCLHNGLLQVIKDLHTQLGDNEKVKYLIGIAGFIQRFHKMFCFLSFLGGPVKGIVLGGICLVGLDKLGNINGSEYYNIIRNNETDLKFMNAANAVHSELFELAWFFDKITDITVILSFVSLLFAKYKVVRRILKRKRFISTGTAPAFRLFNPLVAHFLIGVTPVLITLILKLVQISANRVDLFDIVREGLLGTTFTGGPMLNTSLGSTGTMLQVQTNINPDHLSFCTFVFRIASCLTVGIFTIVFYSGLFTYDLQDFIKKYDKTVFIHFVTGCPIKKSS